MRSRLSARLRHPVLVLEAEALGGTAGVVLERDDGSGLDPLLGSLLDVEIERGRDAQTAVIELRARRVLAAQLRGQLIADAPHEMRRLPALGGLGSEHDRLVAGGEQLFGGVLAVGHRGPAVLGHEGEDLVPAFHDGRIGWNHELALRALALLLAGLEALLDRVAHEVVVRGRLRQRGQDRGLGRRELAEVVDAEVRAGGSLHAVALVAVIDLVQVRGDDVLLARFPRVVLGEADRLDDLLELALGKAARVLEQVVVEEAHPGELLGDGRGAAAAAAQRVEAGREDGDGIEAGVLPERLVLDGRRRVEQDRRDFLELDDLALELAEAGELGAVAVEDDRFLGELVVLHVRDRIEARGERAVEADRRERADGPDAGEEEEEDESEPAGRRGPRGSGARASLAGHALRRRLHQLRMPEKLPASVRIMVRTLRSFANIRCESPLGSKSRSSGRVRLRRIGSRAPSRSGPLQ